MTKEKFPIKELDVFDIILLESCMSYALQKIKEHRKALAEVVSENYIELTYGDNEKRIREFSKLFAYCRTNGFNLIPTPKNQM
jgi:hypothetical protein